MRKLIIFAVIFILAIGSVAFSEDITKSIDKFYGGIADIIERNMDRPHECVEEVSKYYESNSKLVDKIRNLAEKNMLSAMSAAGKSKADSGGSEKASDFTADEESIASVVLTEGSNRYATALQKFMPKHPAEGMKIVAESIKLLPDVKALKPGA